MSTVFTKSLALVEDMEFGFDVSAQVRGGTQFNAAYLPYSLTESVTAALDARYTSAYIDSTFALVGGLGTQTFLVAPGTQPLEAVNRTQLDTKADQTDLVEKADLNQVLTLDNNVPYTPSFSYNPATKQYVDDVVFSAFQPGIDGSFTSGTGQTVTVTNGLITGIL